MSRASVSKAVWRIEPADPRAAVVAPRPPLTPPLSKSDAQRAMVLAFVLDEPAFSGPLAQALTREVALPADMVALRTGLEALQAAKWPVTLDCHDGGAPFRLLLGQVAVTAGARVTLVGSPRLGERPHGPLLAALQAALGPIGLELRSGGDAGNFWPLEVVAPLSSGFGREAPRFTIDGAQSSQFVTSLLLAAASLSRRESRPFTVTLTGEVASAGYLEMTLEWLRRCGFEVEQRGPVLRVVRWQRPAAYPNVPGDWSSLGYLLLVGWRTGAPVERVDVSAAHPDKELLRVLAELGLSVRDVGPQTVRVEGVARGGLTASGEVCPDLLPTLAALACVLEAPSTLTSVGILRHKESDRLEGMRALVAAAGGTTRLDGETLEILPPARVQPFAFDSRGDHRFAMAAATLAVLAGVQLELTGPEVVAKSFPGFWTELEKAGVTVVRAGATAARASERPGQG